MQLISNDSETRLLGWCDTTERMDVLTLDYINTTELDDLNNITVTFFIMWKFLSPLRKKQKGMVQDWLCLIRTLQVSRRPILFDLEHFLSFGFYDWNWVHLFSLTIEMSLPT